MESSFEMNQSVDTARPWALITGASGGIGRHYSIALARDYGYNLYLVSNQQKELADLAIEMRDTYHVQTESLCLNMAAPDAAEHIYEYAQKRNLEVEVLINNAGMLIFNPFCETPLGKIETLLMLHMIALTKLTHLFGCDMRARRKGYILNMSSMSAWMAMPGIQCYNATKAYVLSFSKALHYELRPFGVRVLALTPGSTDTGLLPFGDRFAAILRAVGITMPPARLVRRGLSVLFRSRRRKRCMPGAWNYIIVPIINHLPDWVVMRAMKIIGYY